ncbi:hypothetical protein [Rhizobium oryzicola]|uniref:Uncharacterized protein n=1 Tax=Rhizobium oryzicola TaxID=1232668 RepID=A0ABT8SU72_9HYPH|nr:hypothetical protein [Rhizobium oryzicola]MDO1581994.1 hypothetical protein [Rhizobium oryzicola]
MKDEIFAIGQIHACRVGDKRRVDQATIGIGIGKAAQQRGGLHDPLHFLEKVLAFGCVAQSFFRMGRQVVERLLNKSHDVIDVQRNGSGRFHLAICRALQQALPIGVFGPRAERRKHRSCREDDGEAKPGSFLDVPRDHTFVTDSI